MPTPTPPIPSRPRHCNLRAGSLIMPPADHRKARPPTCRRPFHSPFPAWTLPIPPCHRPAPQRKSVGPRASRAGRSRTVAKPPLLSTPRFPPPSSGALPEGGFRYAAPTPPAVRQARDPVFPEPATHANDVTPPRELRLPNRALTHSQRDLGAFVSKQTRARARDWNINIGRPGADPPGAEDCRNDRRVPTPSSRPLAHSHPHPDSPPTSSERDPRATVTHRPRTPAAWTRRAGRCRAGTAAETPGRCSANGFPVAGGKNEKQARFTAGPVGRCEEGQVSPAARDSSSYAPPGTGRSAPCWGACRGDTTRRLAHSLRWVAVTLEGEYIRVPRGR